MKSRSAKWLLLPLVPLALYGIAKGVAYYQVKTTVDDLVLAAANYATIRYADISTDLRGAATIHGITIQPNDQPDTVVVESVRLSSDDPMFFLRGGRWTPGEDVPPAQLGFNAQGITLPLKAAMLNDLVDAGAVSEPAAVPSADEPAEPETGAAEVVMSGPCADGLRIDPRTLQQLGFTELTIDIDGGYRVDEAKHSLDILFDVVIRDIESIRLSATFDDVDIATLGAGSSPTTTLAAFDAAVRVDPAFGRQAVKMCAIGTDQPVQLWSAQLADHAIAQLQGEGLTLGAGLSEAVRRFYSEWGEFRIQAKPAKPVGLLSLAFMPPEQLWSQLGVRISLNERPIADTSFDWQRPDASNLAGLLTDAEAQDGQNASAAKVPRRVLKRRVFVDVPVSAIGAHVDSEVRIQPRGQPLREGVLKNVVKGEAEIEQLMHGGHFSVFVPLRNIESLQVLTLSEVKRDAD